MYATVRHYSGSDLADQIGNRSEEVAQVIGGVPGVRAYYLIQAGSDSISVTISDDASGGKASSEAAANWIRENLAGSGAPTPEIFEGEVVVSL
jgi:hypothetical protein